MMDSLQGIQGFEFYVALLVAVVLGVIILRKVASCLLRTLFFVAIVAALVFIYLHYFK